MAAKIWAHKGASAYAPENTIPAFKKAIEMGDETAQKLMDTLFAK